LAGEYGLYDWIKALLDNAEIIQSPSSAKKQIQPPPPFEMPTGRLKLVPSTGKRARSTRSVSPSKIASPVKASKASPRKRQTKAMKEANAAHATAASEALQSALDDAVSSTAVQDESVDGTETVQVEVDQSVDVNGDTETTHTNVTVEMPAGSPGLPMPENAEHMLEVAKEMVEQAKALESSPKVSRKRKVEEIEPSDIDAELPVQPAKKAKVLEEKLKREKVRTRALVGVTATLAIA
jgi:hypothetical protein